MELQVTPDQVTNDLDIANAVFQRDRAANAALASNLKKQKDVIPDKQLHEYKKA